MKEGREMNMEMRTAQEPPETTRRGELLPCPFCGGGAEVYPEEESFAGSGFYVSCFQPAFPVTECYCAVGENYDRDAMPEHLFSTKEAAIAAWNTRNDPLRHAAEAVLRVVANKDITSRMKVISQLRAALSAAQE